jgi:peptide/nickel transport system permease protein
MSEATRVAVLTEVAAARPEPARRGAVMRRLARNKLGLVSLVYLVAVLLLVIVLPPTLKLDAEATDPIATLQEPSAGHWLGADENGRDVFARVVLGGRVSLAVGAVAALAATVLSVLIGAASGFFGHWVDAVLMRLTDSAMALPTFFLLLTMLAVFGGGAVAVTVTIGLTSWMPGARIVRAEVLQTRELDFVQAARVAGASDVRLLWRHILPQAVPSIIVMTSLALAFAILTESAISYLGIGIQPPTPSWGNLLMSAQLYVWTAPKLAVYPGLLILLTVLAFNFVGDALRDALDPRLIRLGARP